MDNGNNFGFAGTSNTLGFDFIDSLNAEGHQWAGEPYRSTAASSSGDYFAMYSSSKGELERGYSIYSDQNYLNESDANTNSNLSLPVLQIPTSSSPASPSQSQSVNNESNTFSKHPRSPVAAELNTANILPVDHRRKRIKSARVRQ